MSDRHQGLSYSELEAALGAQNQSRPEDVRSRFRHMRLSNFPPGVRTGTGKRIAYGLEFTTATAAVFELNRAGLSQATAIATVRNNWPEIAKAVAAALAEEGICPPHSERPSPIAQVHLNTLGREEPSDIADEGERSTGHVETSPPTFDVTEATQDGPVMLLNARRLIRPLLERGDWPGLTALRAQAELLDAKFGREASAHDPVLPLHGGTARHDFFQDGPFWPRAAALLSGSDAFRTSRRGRWYRQYIAVPPPVDAWKRFVRVFGELPFGLVFQAWWTRQENEWPGFGYPDSLIAGVPLLDLKAALSRTVHLALSSANS